MRWNVVLRRAPTRPAGLAHRPVPHRADASGRARPRRTGSARGRSPPPASGRVAAIRMCPPAACVRGRRGGDARTRRYAHA
ncbi:hypothetical protein C7S15_6080 [Burkholderia cepacia]|nr:hypothetical protein [Burkholderia cepacia]